MSDPTYLTEDSVSVAKVVESNESFVILMSVVEHDSRGRLFRGCGDSNMSCAAGGGAVETTVDQTLMRGFSTRSAQASQVEQFFRDML